MSDWKDRLRQEELDMTIKYRKLVEFIATADIAEAHMKLLHEQKVPMLEYLRVLGRRIRMLP